MNERSSLCAGRAWCTCKDRKGPNKLDTGSFFMGLKLQKWRKGISFSFHPGNFTKIMSRNK